LYQSRKADAAVELASIVADQRGESDDGFHRIRVARNAIWGLFKESRWPQRAGCASLRDAGYGSDRPYVELRQSGVNAASEKPFERTQLERNHKTS
jgi:hypothetical protein